MALRVWRMEVRDFSSLRLRLFFGLLADLFGSTRVRSWRNWSISSSFWEAQKVPFSVHLLLGFGVLSVSRFRA